MSRSSSVIKTELLQAEFVREAHGSHGPIHLRSWVQRPLRVGGPGTHFGFVHAGKAHLCCDGGSFDLATGMYFCVPGEIEILGGTGLLVTSATYAGVFLLGGPIEATGRLRYIDGCTDSLLLSPVMRGDPCLNLLHFPPHILQTRHTHPSARVGVVARGRGWCLSGDAWIALEAGTCFVIPANCEHAFETGDESLSVVAYHPDSDSGPAHDDHPMLNRSFVEGVPATQLEAIRTRAPKDATAKASNG